MALLIALAVGTGFVLRSHENARHAAAVDRLSEQLDETRTMLTHAIAQLSCANKKLGIPEAARVGVQVTAYALTEDFGPNPRFANRAPARKAYAVPSHALPAERILNVALSPVAEHKLRANLNDMVVLVSRDRSRQHLARFVDRTRSSESRAVVDILFEDDQEARIWGRRSFYAVNISRPDSPFQQP